MSKWQPIETAPKDGTWIISWNGDEVAPASWGDNSEYQRGEVGWCYGSPWYGGTLYDGINIMKTQPTHWMPLPDAPHD